jgi:hypothetical protein
MQNKAFVNVRYLEELRKPTKAPTQDGCCPRRDSYPQPYEYEAGVLTITLRHSVPYNFDVHLLRIQISFFVSFLHNESGNKTSGSWPRAPSFIGPFFCLQVA